MKRVAVAFLGFVLAVVGCSTKYDTEGARSIADSALEANNINGAPSWVMNGGKDGLSAIGSAEITKAGLQFARNEALAMARDELARQISTKVEGVVDNAVQQSIGNNAYDSEVEKYGQQITKQVVSQSLVGTKQKDTWITNDGKIIYVLVEMDSNLADKARKAMLQSITKDSSAPVNKDKFAEALDKALGDALGGK